MKPSPLSQFASFAAASLQKTANRNKITDKKPFSKAPLWAIQGAQPPAVGMPRSYRHTMLTPTLPPLTRKDGTRAYSTDSHLPSFEETLLPHHSLNKEDHQTLKAVLGADVYEKLRHSRHQSGLCHADTTIKIIEAVNGKVSSITSDLVNYSVTIGNQKGPHSIIGGIIANILNVGVPFYEGRKGSSYAYDKAKLLKHGVPDDAIAVVISAVQGAIDPESKQAKAAKNFFGLNAGASRGSNHAFAVLHVDQENRQMLCCDLDPYRQNADGSDKDVYFKVDKDTFDKRVLPRLINGVMAIKKQQDDK